jgi:hypothetical protein
MVLRYAFVLIASWGLGWGLMGAAVTQEGVRAGVHAAAAQDPAAV